MYRRNFWFRLRAAKGVSYELARIAHLNGFAFDGAARKNRWLARRAFGESLGREKHASRHSKQQPFSGMCFQKLLCF